MIELSDYPEVKRWYTAIQARPAVPRGLAAGQDVWADPPLREAQRAELFVHGAARP